MWRKIFLFIWAMAISFLPGAFGYIFTPKHSDDVWYNALNNSVLTPDGWVFGVAWTILYALLGIALYLIMAKDKTRISKTRSYVLFVVQLILNGLWTYLFFGLNLVAPALLTVAALIIVSIWMMIAFRPISKAASNLVWPYIIWLCFAMYLNGTILFLN